MTPSPSSTTIEGRLKQEIDSTIDALEASIRSGEQPPKKKHDSTDVPHRKQLPGAQYQEMYGSAGYVLKQRLVWYTVGAIAITILGLWGWHMRTVLYDASRGSYHVATPLDTAGTYFNEAMQIAGSKDAQAEDAGLTPSSIEALLTAAASTSTPTTTSPLDALISTLESETTSTVSSTPVTSTPTP